MSALQKDKVAMFFSLHVFKINIGAGFFKNENEKFIYCMKINFIRELFDIYF